MTWMETLRFLSTCMPRTVGKALAEQPEGSVREIRVRAGGRASILTQREEIFCSGIFSQQQVGQMAEALCEHALYVRAEEQRQGFVTLRGGHRMGLCGRVVANGQSIRSLREISSLCIRIATQHRGAADALLPYLWGEDGRLRSALIVGLPGMGKTTLLRDACRSLSEQGVHVCIVDERSEIAAMCGGTPQMDVGPNSDVLDGCAKEAGLRWMLRAMAPEVLVTDELGGVQDAQAVLDAARSGVSVIATMHGRDLETALSRGALYSLVQNRAFERYVLLNAQQVGQISVICDEQMRPLNALEAV